MLSAGARTVNKVDPSLRLEEFKPRSDLCLGCGDQHKCGPLSTPAEGSQPRKWRRRHVKDMSQEFLDSSFGPRSLREGSVSPSRLNLSPSDVTALTGSFQHCGDTFCPALIARLPGTLASGNSGWARKNPPLGLRASLHPAP